MSDSMNEMSVAVNYENCGVVLYKFKSKKPIKLNDVIKYLTYKYDFNINKDSVEMVEMPPEEIIL